LGGGLDGFGLGGGDWCRLGFGSLRISRPNKAKQAGQQLRDAGALGSYVGATGMAQANLDEARLRWPAKPREAVSAGRAGRLDGTEARADFVLKLGQCCRKGSVGIKRSQRELGAHGVHGWVEVLHLETLALAKGICNRSTIYQFRAQHLL
jgi:hypothetical protein